LGLNQLRPDKEYCQWKEYWCR